MAAVSVTIQGHVAIITMAGDDGLNDLDDGLRADFADAIQVIGDDDDVRVVIVAGSNGVFATGQQVAPDGLAPRGAGDVVASLSKPTVAWVDGACADMGLELALACDVRFASSASTFAIQVTVAGQLPWDGGTQRLARAVGRGQALRLLLTGEVIAADEALRIGLVERVGEVEEVAAWAERVAAGAPIAAAYTKEATMAAGDLTLSQGLRLENDLSVLLQSTADRAEGLAGFAARRKRKFEGR